MKIKEKVYEKHWDFNKTDFSLVELNLILEDIREKTQDNNLVFEIRMDEEGHYSENNSWDPYTQLTVYKEREESPRERNERQKLKVIRDLKEINRHKNIVDDFLKAKKPDLDLNDDLKLAEIKDLLYQFKYEKY